MSDRLVPVLLLVLLFLLIVAIGLINFAFSRRIASEESR